MLAWIMDPQCLLGRVRQWMEGLDFEDFAREDRIKGKRKSGFVFLTLR